MKYTITRGKCREWPTREYTLEDILARARRDGRTVQDGYGRSNIRGARKLQVVDRTKKRAPVILIAMQEEEEEKRVQQEAQQTVRVKLPVDL